MRYKITLLQVPNQETSFNLEDEGGNFYVCDLKLRTLPNGALIADVAVDAEQQVCGRYCNNRMPLLPTNVINGNLYFEDLYGSEEPLYTMFNDRFALIYDTEFRVG